MRAMSSIPSGGIIPASAVPPPKQIRFVNNEGHPPAKRRRINAACRTCRKRKTRCDGKRPLCSTCTDNNHVCLGYADGIESLPRRPEKHNRQDDRDHYSEEEEKETSSGSFTQHSPPNAGKQMDYAHRTGLETSNSAESRGYEQRDSGIIKEEFQVIPAFEENGPTAMDTTPPVQVESHRVPYFRYFGPTAIVPGYKAMVVAVPLREHRRSTVPTPAPSPGSGGGTVYGGRPTSRSGIESRSRIETPTYDPDPENQLPVNRLIIHLVETFFVHIGCNYPFLKQAKFVQMVEEKQVDAILVNAVCALAARFSDHPLLTICRDRNISKPEYGAVFASRAKAAVVHTFPCPSVAAVQACLLLAYEGFGSDEDSALWMYLGCAIRMAQDLGLQKLDRVKNQARKNQESADSDGKRRSSLDDRMVTKVEAEEIEKEHTDTLWAVFILDRVISSGTGRAVTLKDEEFELAFPETTYDVDTGWPAPFPVLIQIIHLYGRVSDLINNIRSLKDMTPEKMEGLSQFEKQLTAIYQKLDQRLTFNAANFQHYVKAGQGTNFILVHFWFHTLIMLLHQPTLLHSFEGRIQQLLPNSRELSMSSAKTIADILAFAELIDPRSFIGNPFTTQPIYIAACAFLMESVAHSSQPTSRDASPPKQGSQGMPRSKIPRNQKSSTKPDDAKSAAKKEKHSLLATAANQNYQKCYKALEQLEKYWAGTRYILTALDQKAKGIWDPETYTIEEMESTKMKAESQMHSWRDRIPKNFPNTAASPNNMRGVLSPVHDPGSPMGIDPSQALGWSLSGITNSPNSNLAFLYQPVGVSGTQAPPTQPTNTGTLMYDPIRQSVPETNPNIQSTSYNPPYLHHRNSSSSSSGNPQGMLPPAPKYSPITTADSASTSDAEMLLNLTSPFSMSPSASGQIPQHNTSYERSTGMQSIKSPTNTHNQSQSQNQRSDTKTSNNNQISNSSSVYDFGSSMSPYSGISTRGGYTGLPGYNGTGGLGEMMITSQDIDMSALGGDMMPWLQDYLPSDMMNFFDPNGAAGGSD